MSLSLNAGSRTTYAFTISPRAKSVNPTTADSTTAGCSFNVDSTSKVPLDDVSNVTLCVRDRFTYAIATGIDNIIRPTNKPNVIVIVLEPSISRYVPLSNGRTQRILPGSKRAGNVAVLGYVSAKEERGLFSIRVNREHGYVAFLANRTGLTTVVDYFDGNTRYRFAHTAWFDSHTGTSAYQENGLGLAIS